MKIVRSKPHRSYQLSKKIIKKHPSERIANLCSKTAVYVTKIRNWSFVHYRTSAWISWLCKWHLFYHPPKWKCFRSFPFNWSSGNKVLFTRSQNLFLTKYHLKNPLALREQHIWRRVFFWGCMYIAMWYTQIGKKLTAKLNIPKKVLCLKKKV